MRTFGQQDWGESVQTSASTGTATRCTAPWSGWQRWACCCRACGPGCWCGRRGLPRQLGHVRDIGAQAAILLAALSTLAAFVWLRHTRRDLLVASGVFPVLLALEAYVGGEIGKQAWLTAVHFPLAMALMGLAVWIPLRALRRV